jgi:hypothetical protein
VRIIFEGDDPIEVDRRVWQLFSKMSVRKAIEQVIAPLFKQGIDTFKIRHKGKETLKVAEDEAKYFLAPTEHEGETISSTETRVVIVAPSFQEGKQVARFRRQPQHLRLDRGPQLRRRRAVRP